MPLKADQRENFTHEVLPLLFHNETDKFFNYIHKDGKEFIKFWWDRAGVNLEESMRNSFEGMDFDFRKSNDGREVVLLRLPPPKKINEVYFMALVAKPKKRSILSWRNLARIFALSRSTEENGEVTTVLSEVTRTARYVRIGKGPKPTMKAFYKVVSEILDRKLKLGWL